MPLLGLRYKTAVQLNLCREYPEHMEQGVSDLVNDGMKWLEETGDYGMMKSLAVADMLICGMGFFEHKLEYTDNPNGKVNMNECFLILCYGMSPHVIRTSQALIGFVRAKIIDRNKLHQYLKGMTADERDEASADFGSAVDARFLNFFDTIMVVKSLGVIYHYQWRELEFFYRVENPLQGYEGDPEDHHTQAIVLAARILQEKYKFNPFTDKIFAVPLEDYLLFKESVQEFGL